MSPRVTNAIFAALVFGCGLIAGLLTDHFWEARTVRAVSVNNESRVHVIEKVSQELSLTQQQSHDMEAILDDASKQFDSLHMQAHAVRRQTMDRIRAILTEDQKPKFEAAVTKLQRTISSSSSSQ
jgi:Spy/CpxP family protein refolding chaperone